MKKAIQARISKLIIGHEGMDFAYTQHPLIISDRSKTQRKGFPEFKLVDEIVDNSVKRKLLWLHY